MLRDHRPYATIATRDLADAKAWYQEKLGLTPAWEDGGAAAYAAGGSLLMLYQSDFAGTAKNTVATWIVDDIHSVMSELRARGVEFEDYAMGDRGPTTEGGVARDEAGGFAAWFKDADENVMSIIQLPPGMPLPG